MNWGDLSSEALDVMKQLGNFGPTVRFELREVKGYTDGGKCYYNSRDLREIAAGCIEVADWLDKRATDAGNSG